MENMEHALPNMQALYHAAESLLVTCSHRDKLNLILDFLQEELAWDRGWLALVVKKQATIRGEGYFGISVPPEYAFQDIPLDPALKNKVVTAVFKKRAIVVNDPLNDPHCHDCREVLVALGTRCFLIVPLILRGHVIGVIAVDRAGERFNFTNDDVELLTAFANLAALSIENARLHDEAKELSLTDKLTGLRNIRFFREQLGHETARASRTRQALSVAVVAVDYLKAVNDRFGHQAGDALLREIGYMLRACLRSTDVVARHRGDEFVILLHNVDTESACIPAKRCLESVRQLAPVANETKATVSIGIASYPTAASDQKELLQRAEALCYKAKRAGGNLISTPKASD